MQRLERAALRQIFYELDLPVVPGLAFEQLKSTHDPVKAFANFAQALGVDAEDVRDRVDGAHERMELAVDLLVQFSSLRDVVLNSQQVWERIFAVLADTSGTHPLATLRSFVERVEAVGRLHRLGLELEASPAKLAIRLRDKIRTVIAEDPLGDASEDIAQGIALAHRLKIVLDRFETAWEIVKNDHQWLTEHESDTMVMELNDWFNIRIDLFQETRQSFMPIRLTPIPTTCRVLPFTRV